MKRIKMTVRGTRYRTRHNLFWGRTTGGYGLLCVSGLSRVADVPKEATVLYAVFTKTGYNDAKFTLTIHEKRNWIWEWSGGYRVVKTPGVEETRAELTCGAENIIRSMMREGYKYVHFEYEV